MQYMIKVMKTRAFYRNLAKTSIKPVLFKKVKLTYHIKYNAARKNKIVTFPNITPPSIHPLIPLPHTPPPHQPKTL